MKTTVKIEKEVDIKTLEVEANVRHWEDSIINGVDDEFGYLTPAREGNLWCPIIDIDSGIVKDWPRGTIADIHFKVCDAGVYKLKDENGNVVIEKVGYVPNIMCPNGKGYGDYIIMRIDENGKIENWKADISDFKNDEY
jgi:hypothetical protein